MRRHTLALVVQAGAWRRGCRFVRAVNAGRMKDGTRRLGRRVAVDQSSSRGPLLCCPAAKLRTGCGGGVRHGVDAGAGARPPLRPQCRQGR